MLDMPFQICNFSNLFNFQLTKQHPHISESESAPFSFFED